MGNTLGGKKTAKVMRIDGQTMKLKTPVNAGEVVKDYPGHVLLESEAVKHYGIRAKPLEPQEALRSKRLYFLVELPKFPAEAKAARRVRSGIQMSARDRLENLMLARRSVSDLSIMKPASMSAELAGEKPEPAAAEKGAVRLKVRLSKAEVEKLMMESKDESEAAEKIMRLCMANNGSSSSTADNAAPAEPAAQSQTAVACNRGLKTRQRKVGFLPIMEGEIQQLAVAS
ncbi:PREDICTED: uncharacterized protein At1g66480-like [Ipomoea nil]|uniref:uncharacterized protein At1g66480-like n=1 Tax=Ipomoea nil TaxID=35883 RepID=UPI00090139F9|nr:PREDICTED: uncharacterized protein At1g66480-like [Ipomoea nil]